MESFDDAETLISLILNHFVRAVTDLKNAKFDGTKISSCSRDGINRLGKFRPNDNMSPYDMLMQIIDCVSSMTDRFLLKTIDELHSLGYCGKTNINQFKT